MTYDALDGLGLAAAIRAGELSADEVPQRGAGPHRRPRR